MLVGYVRVSKMGKNPIIINLSPRVFLVVLKVSPDRCVIPSPRPILFRAATFRGTHQPEAKIVWHLLETRDRRIDTLPERHPALLSIKHHVQQSFCRQLLAVIALPRNGNAPAPWYQASHLTQSHLLSEFFHINNVLK